MREKRERKKRVLKEEKQKKKRKMKGEKIIERMIEVEEQGKKERRIAMREKQ